MTATEAETKHAKSTSGYAMPMAMIEEIKRVAGERGTSASALVRAAVERYLVELEVEAQGTPVVQLPGGAEAPLVTAAQFLIPGVSSHVKDNPCISGAQLAFWRPLTTRQFGAFQPRLLRLVAALHVEEQHRQRNGGPP